ncbi:hypothetical protein [Nostoc sp. WHI]|uniref:hypothetical protein n=1 Tax=Nostoc sp. WHI TaxID=2650611 RepID=UPI0018C6AB7F|nr:hypothetical protein [Nostoc sp. WHI]MBG1268279.1 hypothetical protein [Nostoc sp. WHI]
MNLQKNYELRLTEQKIGEEIQATISPRILPEYKQVMAKFVPIWFSSTTNFSEVGLEHGLIKNKQLYNGRCTYTIITERYSSLYGISDNANLIKLLENEGFEDIKLELLEGYIGFEKVTD